MLRRRDVEIVILPGYIFGQVSFILWLGKIRD